MKQSLVFCLTAALLIGTAHRAPAPISEIETSTPAPKPKAKRTIKPKASESSERSTKRQTPSPQPQKRPTPNQTPFAGTWVGTTSVGDQGNVVYTLTVNADGSTVTENTSAWGSKIHPAKWDGVTLKWPSYFCHWTLTPSADGQTAQVMIYGPFTSNPTPTYRKQTSKAN
ncbi:MAG: hypothetical protein QOC70_1114 [Verrucomicrobiota bacterium]|jgi:cytoskeletal protein RodZ